jgi:hypothetical protein
VIDALLQRTLREPEIAQIVLAACTVWVRENATGGGGGLDVDALGRVWCTCAAVGDADVKTAVVDSIIGVLDMPSLDRFLDCPVRTAVWAIGETNQLLLPQSAGPKVCALILLIFERLPADLILSSTAKWRVCPKMR